MKEPRFIAPEEMVRAIGPVTRRELEQLRQEREKAAPILVLTPSGEMETVIRKFERSRRAVRESYIQNRLERMEGHASEDFARARIRGKARHDFDRER